MNQPVQITLVGGCSDGKVLGIMSPKTGMWLQQYEQLGFSLHSLDHRNINIPYQIHRYVVFEDKAYWAGVVWRSNYKFGD